MCDPGILIVLQGRRDGSNDKGRGRRDTTGTRVCGDVPRVALSERDAWGRVVLGTECPPAAVTEAGLRRRDVQGVGGPRPPGPPRRLVQGLVGLRVAGVGAPETVARPLKEVWQGSRARRAGGRFGRLGGSPRAPCWTGDGARTGAKTTYCAQGPVSGGCRGSREVR